MNPSRAFSITGGTDNTVTFGLYIACGFTPSCVRLIGAQNQSNAKPTLVEAIIPTDGSTAPVILSAEDTGGIILDSNGVSRYLGKKSLAASTEAPAYWQELAGVVRYYNSVGTVLDADYIDCVFDAEGNRIAYSSTNDALPKSGQCPRGILIDKEYFVNGQVTAILIMQ